MERKLIITEDGSSSIAIPELSVTYHSIHGAIQESMHVFIETGLNYVINQSTNKSISILEMGFGTGLNALLTAMEAEKIEIKIHYISLEKFPISIEEAEKLNYSQLLGHEELFQKIYDCNWNEDVNISDHFVLHKENVDLIDYSSSQQFNLIYYDAFAPSAQPELWTKGVFEKLFGLLKPNGVLVTYCSKGDVRRAMMAAGFDVKKLPGPPGKREILRAIKY